MVDRSISPSFDCAMYGALLRHKRMEIGYRKADDFVADLKEVGYSISRAALYRIERGEQEPPVSFFAAANLVLYGRVDELDLIESCMPQGWFDPLESDDVLRVLKGNGVLKRLAQTQSTSVEQRAAAYEEIMNRLNAFDFSVWKNGSSTDDRLCITVAEGAPGEIIGNAESYEIDEKEDIERAVLNFLKNYGYELPGREIVKLVDYANRKIGPELEWYIERWSE